MESDEYQIFVKGLRFDKWIIYTVKGSMLASELHKITAEREQVPSDRFQLKSPKGFLKADKTLVENGIMKELNVHMHPLPNRMIPKKVEIFTGSPLL